MNIIEGALLGALQGLTEFIPVSSSGHLVIAEHVLGIHTSQAFDALVNLGTFLALLIYFRVRIWNIAMRLFRDRDARLVRNLFITALPVGIVGYFFDEFFALPFIKSPVTVAIMLIAVGIIMIFIDRLPTMSIVPAADELPPKRAGLIGLAQVAALIPGTSRSGATIIAGRLAGLNYEKAAEYSFLVSIPVMAAVVAKGLLGSQGQAFIAANFDVWLISNIASFIFGLLAVGFMLRFLAKGNLKVFGHYRIGLGLIIAVFIGIGLF